MSLMGFNKPGKADFVIGGQFGSEAKGAAAAWLMESGHEYDVFTCANGAQAGHTSYFNGEKIVCHYLPSAAVIDYRMTGKYKPVYVNAGAVIEPNDFVTEIAQYYDPTNVFVHPSAAVITPECREASQQPGSASRKRAGVGTGVGQAISRKVLRTGMIARYCPQLRGYLSMVPLNSLLEQGKSVLVEVPQGFSLSLSHSEFYPFTTSRDCTIMQAMNDAAIHPHYYGATLAVIRTFPIRVGSTADGYSGDCYPDQHEVTWESIGVPPELTTVSKRVRRVFTFSKHQLDAMIELMRPDWLMLTFTNYCSDEQLAAITALLDEAGFRDNTIFQWGPTSADVGDYESMIKHRKGK